MPDPNTPEGSAEVLAAVKAQLSELQPTFLNLAQIVSIKAALAQLKVKLTGAGAPAGLGTAIDAAVAAIPDEHGELSAFGDVLGKLYELQQNLVSRTAPAIGPRHRAKHPVGCYFASPPAAQLSPRCRRDY